MFTDLCPHMYKIGILIVNCSNITPHSRQCFDYYLVFPTFFRGFLHLASSMQLIVVVLVGTLGLEFVLGFAPLESSLSQLVLVSASLGLHLVSTWVHVESVVVHLVSALIHLAIQTI
ncbi:hypothetical protein Tco_1102659 [Tanacetum coccineum]